MGCCNSVPTAPDVIIPDPAEGEACTFALKKAGMMTSDYVAYKGEDVADDTQKWQVRACAERSGERQRGEERSDGAA